MAMIMVAVLVSLFDCSSSGQSSITASTVERAPLEQGAVIETAYFTDEGDWIANPNTLEQGLKNFYIETGVQPYLYILANGSVTSPAELSQMSSELYGQLFNDEAHFLVLFCDDNHGSYNVGYTVGTRAKTVMDAEALDVFRDYLDRNYYDYSLTEEEIFADTFAETADRIMTTDAKRNGPVYITVAIVGGIVVVAIIVLIILRQRSRARAAEQKRQQEILSTPLEKFGDTELEDLARKYEGAQAPEGNANSITPSEAQDAATTQQTMNGEQPRQMSDE